MTLSETKQSIDNSIIDNLLRYLRPLDLTYLPYLADVIRDHDGPLEISETQIKSLRRLIYHYEDYVIQIIDWESVHVFKHLKMQLLAHINGPMQLTSGMIQIVSKLLDRLSIDVADFIRRKEESQ